jgi:hypothetical protein
MAKSPADIRSLARSHTKLALQTLSGIARSSTSDPARVSAAQALLDRGWGKAAQILAGDEDGGPLVINIIHRTRGDKD